MLRLVPLSEVASGAASALRDHALTPITAAWQASEKRDRAAHAILPDLSGRVATATNGASPLVKGKVVLKEQTKEPPLDRDLSGDLNEDPLAGAFGAAASGHVRAEDLAAAEGAPAGVGEGPEGDDPVGEVGR